MILGILRNSWLWFVWLVIFTDCAMGWKVTIWNHHLLGNIRYIFQAPNEQVQVRYFQFIPWPNPILKKWSCKFAACSFHFNSTKKSQPLLGAWWRGVRPENIQMLPRIHIFQGTALNETDLSGISSLDGSGVGHGKASGYEMKHWQK